MPCPDLISSPTGQILDQLLDLARERQNMVQEGLWDPILENHRQRQILFSRLHRLVESGHAMPTVHREVLGEICRLDAQLLPHLEQRQQEVKQDLNAAGLTRKVLVGYGNSQGGTSQRPRFTDSHH